MSSSAQAPSTTTGRATGRSPVFAERNLRYAVRGEEAEPLWLWPRDEGWIDLLIGAAESLDGTTAGEFDEAVEGGLMDACRGAGGKPGAIRAMLALVRMLYEPSVRSSVRPCEIRHVLFELAATGIGRDQAIGRTAELLALEPDRVLELAYADRPGARRLRAPAEGLSAFGMAQLYNLALARGLLARSSKLAIRVQGDLSRLAREANLKRLLWSCQSTPSGLRLELSGPMALFRHTTRYGNALSAFLPALMGAPGWSVAALCKLRGESLVVRISCRDPIVPVQAPASTADSVLERKLIRSVRKAATDWVLERAARPVRAASRVYFPDFELRRGDHRIPVELAGYFTRAHLQAKLEVLRAAGAGRYIVCVDDAYACADDEVQAENVLRYRKSIDAGELIALAERLSGLRALAG